MQTPSLKTYYFHKFSACLNYFACFNVVDKILTEPCPGGLVSSDRSAPAQGPGDCVPIWSWLHYWPKSEPSETQTDAEQKSFNCKDVFKSDFSSCLPFYFDWQTYHCTTMKMENTETEFKYLQF